MRPVLKSWGRLLPAMPKSWDDEFTWSGTRDPSAYLSIPVAIETMQSIGIREFRERSYALSSYARQRLIELTGQPPIARDDWYGCMAHVPLPAVEDGSFEFAKLQDHLWQTRGIEVPIIEFNDRWFVRVSSHFYNRREQIDTLIDAIAEFISR